APAFRGAAGRRAAKPGALSCRQGGFTGHGGRRIGVADAEGAYAQATRTGRRGATGLGRADAIV
ncbi:MAG TPA: hypothetical protein VML58_19395, partial [Burkholderiaceae bacterium]|nr:hypothetical protein [Burkholderiaceae bacterium]